MENKIKITKPDLDAFAKDLLSDWPEFNDIEAGDIHEKAIKHGLLQKVEGGFDPEIHGDTCVCAELGDTWYIKTF